MRHIRNWYKLLEGQGLVANDSGPSPGAAHGTLSPDVTWVPYTAIDPDGLTLTGTLTPDATGLYVPTGTYNGQLYCYNTKGFYLWWDPTDDFWTISSVLGSHAAGYWYAEGSPTITGSYTPSTVTGIGTLTGRSWLTYKGVEIYSSQSRITSLAAAGFPAAAGSIEMLVRPAWNYNDGLDHWLWKTYGGPNSYFALRKFSNSLTYLYTDSTGRGSFTCPWATGALYHLVLNWGTNQLWINGTLAYNFTDGGLGLGASTLYIGDDSSGTLKSFNGIIYYFIARDVALTQAEIADFRAFFENQYIPQIT